MDEKILTDKSVFPTEEIIFSAIGKSALLWQAFFERLHTTHPDLSAEWRYYNDGKRWLMKVQKKTKTVCWITVIQGGFTITSYFTDKAEDAIFGSSLSDALKEQFRDGKRYGRLRALTITPRNKKDIAHAQTLLALKLSMK